MKLFLKMLALVVLAEMLGVCAPELRAQSTQATSVALPSFEVASIKRHAGEEAMIRLDGGDPGRYIVTNMPLKLMIEFAYGIQDFQISGGPSWIESERFDIDAKIDDSMAEQLRSLSHDQQEARKNLMVQRLLADRFNLKLTHETKELPAYALIVAKSGPKLTEVPPPGPLTSQIPTPARASGPPPLPPGTSRMFINKGQMTMEAKAEPISRLTGMLSQQRGRIVLDQTGLNGTYDFTLTYALEASSDGGTPPPGGAESAPVDAAPLFSAIQEQLGLRLESIKAPVDIIVVDHVEEPSSN